MIARARCHRNPCQPPTCVPCIQVFSRANNRSQALDLYRSGRFLHKINNLAASAACGEVCQKPAHVPARAIPAQRKRSSFPRRDENRVGALNSSCSLLLERVRLRILQQFLEIYVQIARIGSSASSAARLLNPARRKFLNNCFLRSSITPSQLPADSRFMHMERLGNLLQGSPIDIVSGQQKSLLHLPAR
jgi:hypothetical protein